MSDHRKFKIKRPLHTAEIHLAGPKSVRLRNRPFKLSFRKDERVLLTESHFIERFNQQY